MFGEILLIALAGGGQISIPIGKTPRHVEQPIAPLQIQGPIFAKTCEGADDRSGWEKPAPPVRIHANTYYVGTCGITSILIHGEDGDILIDGGTEADADLIADNIRELGFRLSDVKIILHSHEHFDHIGGIARLQQLTGAQLYASPAAAKVFATGVASSDDPQVGLNKPFPSAHVDRIIQDGEQVRLGNIMLTAVATPGHTPGALTWHWGACDGGVCRQIVYADSLTPISRDDYRFSDRPAYVAAYRASIAKVAALDCDILITPHPAASHLVERFARRSIEDTEACRNYADGLTKALDERLAKEAAASAPTKP
jgi:metallo-beta-lactamase class B